MKRLYLIRHAKSSWQNSEIIKDIDRPLNTRGVKAAYEMSARLLEKGVIPDFVLSSSGIRALHTAVIFSHQLGFDTRLISIKQELYHAPAGEILHQISLVDASVDNLFLFAHNPGINDFYAWLNKKYQNIPTCAVISFSVATEWSKIRFDDLKILNLDFPKKEL